MVVQLVSTTEGWDGIRLFSHLGDKTMTKRMAFLAVALTVVACIQNSSQAKHQDHSDMSAEMDTGMTPEEDQLQVPSQYVSATGKIVGKISPRLLFRFMYRNLWASMPHDYFIAHKAFQDFADDVTDLSLLRIESIDDIRLFCVSKLKQNVSSSFMSSLTNYVVGNYLEPIDLHIKKLTKIVRDKSLSSDITKAAKELRGAYKTLRTKLEKLLKAVTSSQEFENEQKRLADKEVAEIKTKQAAASRLAMPPMPIGLHSGIRPAI